MRKVEIAERIAAATDLTKTKADEAVEAILATIKAGLQQGERVLLRGLGTFAVRAKRARMGRNPKTGAAAAIPPRRVVAFKAGQVFKQAVAGVPLPAVAPPPPSAQAPAERATPRASRATPVIPGAPAPPSPPVATGRPARRAARPTAPPPEPPSSRQAQPHPQAEASGPRRRTGTQAASRSRVDREHGASVPRRA